MESIVGKYRQVLLKQPLVDVPEQNLLSEFKVTPNMFCI
jgi:hypothetical protein